MIELTEQQMLALENPEATPPRVVNPRTKETFALLRIDEYERRQEHAYDDSPRTREELQSLAWEAAERTCGDEYNDPVEEPRTVATLFWSAFHTRLVCAGRSGRP